MPKPQRVKLNKITNELATPVPEKQKTDKLLCYKIILQKSYPVQLEFSKKSACFVMDWIPSQL